MILSLEMDSVTRCSTPEHLINRLKQFRGPFRVRKYFEYKVRNSRLSVSEGSFSTQIEGQVLIHSGEFQMSGSILFIQNFLLSRGFERRFLWMLSAGVFSKAQFLGKFTLV